VAVLNALSIDLEDWFHAELVRAHVREDWPEWRVEWAVEPILLLLQEHGVKATFFVVGDVLRHHRELIRRIYEEGHEIACHGWSHRPLWELAPERFAWELAEFDRELESLVPLEEVVGFRAPTFSLDERTSWALNILQEQGYLYDSSIFPMRTGLYGVPGAPSHPYRPVADDLLHDHPEGPLLEFPLPVVHLAGVPVPLGGGFYLRFWPLGLLLALLRRLNAQGYPFVLYLHPWEADAQTPRVRGLSLWERFVTYYNARSVLSKMRVLLQSFAFAPLKEVLGVGQRRGGRRK